MLELPLDARPVVEERPGHAALVDDATLHQVEIDAFEDGSRSRKLAEGDLLVGRELEALRELGDYLGRSWLS